MHFVDFKGSRSTCVNYQMQPLKDVLKMFFCTCGPNPLKNVCRGFIFSRTVDGPASCNSAEN